MKKKKISNTIDLNDRKNIKIIPSDNDTISDYDMETFIEQLNTRSKLAEDFCNYYVEKQIEDNNKLSEEEFNKTLKDLKKHHKILKILLNEHKN